MTSSSSSTRLLWARLRNLKSLAFNIIDMPVIVLCYHRVTARPIDINSVVVSPDNFFAQMEYLKMNFKIVRFEENWDHSRKPAVVITFDDGYADNLMEALPILSEVGVPATFFISTENIGSSKEFWWDELEGIVLGESDCPDRFIFDNSKYSRAWLTGTLWQRKNMYRDLHGLFMRTNSKQRTDWLQQLRGWAGKNEMECGPNRVLTQDELKILAGNRWVTIGAHTVTHPRLSFLSEEEQRYEIIESKHQLEQLLGKEVSVFAYPFGKKNDFDRTSVRICHEAGFLKAAAAFPGEVHRWNNPYQIPRHFIYNWDLDGFAKKIKSLWV